MLMQDCIDKLLLMNFKLNCKIITFSNKYLYCAAQHMRSKIEKNEIKFAALLTRVAETKNLEK